MKNPALDFIRISIISDISNKLARLQERREACIVRSAISTRHFKELEHEANTHSYKIEHPEEPFTHYNSHSNGRANKNGKKNLEDAHRYCLASLERGFISQEDIKRIASLCEPQEHKERLAKYREFGEKHLTNVRPSGSSFTPPTPEKLPGEMEKYVEELSFYLSDPSIPYVLHAAAYAHLHMARIHPFEDGNGRTSRIIQNAILRKGGLPPAVIFQGERFDYYDRLDSAKWGWRERTGQKSQIPSKGEKNFFEYIAGKVSASLDRLI